MSDWQMKLTDSQYSLLIDILEEVAQGYVVTSDEFEELYREVCYRVTRYTENKDK